jgi:hypothetical protein
MQGADKLIKYSYGPYNKFNNDEQWIRITEGCPHSHPYCYEPKEIKVFGIPEIVRNSVKIIDMNLLCKPEALGILLDLSKKRVNGKVVYYELICGIDYRFLNQELADMLKTARFQNIRIAWDWWFKNQYQIWKAKEMLLKAGFIDQDLTIFMICNWKIPHSENMLKLDLCKVWRVKVADCWFDNQISPHIKPLHWTEEQIKNFRRRVRKHNQLVRFGIDPEISKSEELQEEILF